MSNDKKTPPTGRKPRTRKAVSTPKKVEVQEVESTEIVKVDNSSVTPVMATQTQNVIFDPFYTPPADTIHYMEGYPKEWKADSSSKGGFALEGETNINQELQMEILLFQEFRQSPLFWQAYEKTPIQDWVVVYFVDSENKLSTTFLKKRNFKSFENLKKRIGASASSFGASLVTAKMTDAVSKNGEKYKYVEFSFKPNTPARIEKLKDFYMANLVIEDGEVIGTRIYSQFVNELIESSKDFYASERYEEYLKEQEEKEKDAQPKIEK